MDLLDSFSQKENHWLSRHALLAMISGALVTLLLLWAMQYLIESADRSLDTENQRAILDFIRLKKAETVERKQRKPEKPPKPETAPPEPPPPNFDDIDPADNNLVVPTAQVSTRINLSAEGFGLGFSEGDYLPIVKIAPMYPQRALNRGIEGECIVEFTVTTSGTTRDAKAVAGSCRGLFEKASVNAALKFKYKPRVVNGKAIEVSGIRNKFTFRLQD